VANLRISVYGDDAHIVADELAAIVGDGESNGTVSRSISTSQPDQAQKVIDPNVVLEFILAFRGAVFAIKSLVDLVPERQKARREKAQKLLETARRFKREKRVSMVLTDPDGKTWSLERLETDRFIEIAESIEEN
jgi:hypothetical protein